MAELVARTPCEGLLPLTAGRFALNERHPAALTTIAPAPGREGAVSAALKAAHGMAFPAPGRATGREGARCIWWGPGVAMLVGPPPAPLAEAALTDQSDGWAVIRLTGAGCEAVLARLVAVDLRPGHFRRGHTARTLLFHAPASLTRIGAHGFDIMVFRSMAASAVHELSVAMKSMAARG